MLSRRVRMALLGAASGATAAHIYTCTRDYQRDKPPVTMTKYMLLRTFPMHSMSSIAAILANLEIPIPLRKPAYTAFAHIFKADLTECAAVESFSSFQSFFTRPLLDGCRPIDKQARVVSPCDGVVVSSGRVDAVDGRFEAVKGVYYNLSDLLGEYTDAIKTSSSWWPFKSKKTLHYTTIYLAPGDYHRFHSPTDTTITACDHVKGMKLPVSPPFLHHCAPDTLRLNQRAVIVGEGVAVVPVGALNVSCIDLQDLRVGGKVKKGDLLGQFKLGSTIILFYTADDGFDGVRCGPIKMGQRIY